MQWPSLNHEMDSIVQLLMVEKDYHCKTKTFHSLKAARTTTKKKYEIYVIPP